MAVPSNPTPTIIVTEGLKRGGRTNPTTTQLQDALDHQLQEVKADIALACPTHPLLLTTSTMVTMAGEQRYPTPDDLNIHSSITLLDGTYRGTSQAATNASIILDPTFTGASGDVQGHYILITGGTGAGQYREVISYDVTTKTAMVDEDWASPPTSNTYLIVYNYWQLYPLDTKTDFDRLLNPTILARPKQASVFSQEFLLYPVPDLSTYGLLNRYYADLSKLDELGDLFTQLLREWRSIWIQGIAVKTMQRYDEDRYQLELSIYKEMLTVLASHTCTVTQVRFNDF